MQIITGDFKAGRYYGQGKLTTAEGVYEGQWADDRREGKGTWKAANGLVYEGEWHSDLVRKKRKIGKRAERVADD